MFKMVRRCACAWCVGLQTNRLWKEGQALGTVLVLLTEVAFAA